MKLENKIESAKKYNRLFQGLVSILSNHRCGVKINDDFRPKSIFKYEGGVIVNGKEIVIGYDCLGDKISCYDDYEYNNKLSKESKVAESAATYLLEKINWDVDEVEIQEQIENLILSEINISKESFYNILSRYCNNPFGDPLRSLFL